MTKVSYKSTVIVDSDNFEVVEGNKYFAPSALANSDYFTLSNTAYSCPWKGKAQYYNLSLPDGTVVKDFAWGYPNPKDAAKNIAGYYAFDKKQATFA